jgi:hypothetical protein
MGCDVCGCTYLCRKIPVSRASVTPAKPSVLRRSYQRASITARAIFELSILALWVHIVAIAYYRYLSATAPYYNFIANVSLFIAPAWFLISSYQLLGQTRETYEPSNCPEGFTVALQAAIAVSRFTSRENPIMMNSRALNCPFVLLQYARRICLS